MPEESFMVIALCEFRSKHKKWPSFRIPELGNNFQMNGIVEKSPLETGFVHIVQGSRWKVGGGKREKKIAQHFRFLTFFVLNEVKGSIAMTTSTIYQCWRCMGPRPEYLNRDQEPLLPEAGTRIHRFFHKFSFHTTYNDEVLHCHYYTLLQSSYFNGSSYVLFL